jgi:ABC-2 type transport system permease protein
MMPDVLQLIAQALPVYWLGLGLRSVFLPDAAVVLEIGESWRRVETVLVLTAYAIAGSFVALGVLRRMARRESGSAVEARRREAMQRI